MVGDSALPTQVSPLGGIIAGPDTLHLFVLYSGATEAQLTDRFHVSVSYMSDD